MISRKQLLSRLLREGNRTYWISAWKRFKKNKGAFAGLFVVMIIFFSCLLAPIIAPYDPLAMNPASNLQSPSQNHYFGTDRFGRDVFSRTLYGGWKTLQSALLAVTVAASLGIIPGLLAGFFGTWIDAVVSRMVDILLAFPSILLALTIIAILGPGISNAMVAVGISLTPSYVRLVRSEVMSLRERTFVEAAKALGATQIRIIRKHIITNLTESIIVLSTVQLGWAIVIGASLNFLGMGVQPPTPEWGADLAMGRDYLKIGWWISIFPGLGIMFTILSFNLIGDGLRDAIDPKLKS
jgi:peptide/nickel transport system permease protein